MAEREPNHELEEIVAYLDGELSPEAGLQVENRLASDESYRRQLQGIERAWGALDELPLEYVDDKFSRTTMSLAVQEASAEVRQQNTAIPMIRRRRRWSMILGAAAAFALGFLFFKIASDRPDRGLAADLRLIDNIDAYSQVSDVAFLRRLRRTLGPELAPLGVAPEELNARVERYETIANPQNRWAWLAALDDDERSDLRSKYNRFTELSAEERERLQALDAELSGDAADAAELRTTMLAYHQWLGAVPPDRQFELREMPIGERVETVNEWSAAMRDHAPFVLTEEELQRLFSEIREPLNEIRRSMGSRAPGGGRRTRGDPRGGGREGFLLESLGRLHRELRDAFAGDGLHLELERQIIDALPERTREPFAGLPPGEQVERFFTWMRQHQAAQGEISQQELERFFAEELDVATRTELLRLPAGELEQALRARYRRQPFPGWTSRDSGGPDDRRPWFNRWPRGEGRPPGPPHDGMGRPGDFGDRPRRDEPGRPPGPRPMGPPPPERAQGPPR